MTDFRAGLAKSEMTAFIPGIGMMGYGQLHNKVQEVATPLWARAMVLEDSSGKIFILVHLEQAFVTLAIKEEILLRLQQWKTEWSLSEADLLVTAQHTHSAPGGYSHYPFYNFTIPNFQWRIFEKVVSAAVDAIKIASSSMFAAKISWGDTQLENDKEVAFNRSMRAYLRNPEVTGLTLEDKHLAVDRSMEALLIKDEAGQLKGILNWFGVHCTSISSYNQRIHSDNKGVAAELFERSHPGCLAFFLQAAAGDVSPNFIWNKKQRRMGGKYEDQYESAAYNGELQFRAAEKINAQKPVQGSIKSFHAFADMSLICAPPAHGVAFFMGTLEGPGVHPVLGAVLKGLSRIVRQLRLIRHQEDQFFYHKHGHKDVMLDHRNGDFVGVPLRVWQKLPLLPEPTINEFQNLAKNNALKTLPWVPAVIPFQLVEIGPILIISVPGEMTTMAASRLKQHVRKKLNLSSETRIIMAGYANAYMGYVTTPEEYDVQCYEGGHTIYGRDTLHGIMHVFDLLIEEKLSGKRSSELLRSCFHFDPAELALRSE